jgi:asparaginyl-tRNA synthetase
VKGPYEALADGRIRYRGNRCFDPVDDVRGAEVPVAQFQRRVEALAGEALFRHVARVNHLINITVHEFFDSLGALFTLLPLTTRMISSPGAVYGREAIDYTTDTCPLTLDWFDCDRPGFLSESSQIYLELALAQPGVEQAYCVYNSFRKEQADATHLTEFHHVEYEGRVDQAANERIVTELLAAIVEGLVENAEEQLGFFLAADELAALQTFAHRKETHRLTFEQALELLHEDTGDPKYREFTMDGRFGSWEEIRLTQLAGGVVAITEFPLLEVPFYHASVRGSEPPVANNTDFIWTGYREIVGSGQRIETASDLDAKAEIFRLPREDYVPYLQTRSLPDWSGSSGFGLGWERLLQGVLSLPYIWSSVHFPRTHLELAP